MTLMYSHENKIHVLKLLILLILNISLSETQILKVANAETDTELLTNIDEVLNNAFETLSRAEENGAQINDLIKELNKANSLYQELKTALREGDTEKATIIAQECVSISLQVTKEANNLATAALKQSKTQRERRNLILRAAIIAVTISSLIIWKRFKQYYTKQALGMKPTVIEDEPK